jgi:hypothetical protein
MSVTSIESLRRFVRARFAGAISCGAILLVSGATFHSAFGTPVNYGTFVGNTVAYVDVSEDSNSGDPLPLFGAPTVSGDSLDFNPIGFNAHASGAAGSDITDANLTFGVSALPNFAIKNITLSEAGDTTLSGFGTNATITSVTADGHLNISEVDGSGIGVIAVPIALTFTPNGGLYKFGDHGGGPIFHTAFSGSLFLDIQQILNDHFVSFQGGATKISIDIDNTLVATSEDGTFSLIAKKDFGGVSVTVNNPLGGGGPNSPEPTSLVLAFLGFAGLAIRRLAVR